MLSLRHGQVAWTLPRGLPPSQGLLDRLRYLQQFRVPLEREELAWGAVIDCGTGSIIGSNSGSPSSAFAGAWHYVDLPNF